MWHRNRRRSAVKITVKTIATGAALAAMVWMGWREYPALKRYLKLSRM
jgi:hypothetical protein